MSKVNEVSNEIREVLNLPDDKERHQRIAALLEDLSKYGVDVVTKSADPGFTTAVNFGAFSLISLMIGAQEINEKNIGSFVNMVQTVVGMSTMALTEREAEAKHGEEEENAKE